MTKQSRKTQAFRIGDLVVLYRYVGLLPVETAGDGPHVRGMIVSIQWLLLNVAVIGVTWEAPDLPSRVYVRNITPVVTA